MRQFESFPKMGVRVTLFRTYTSQGCKRNPFYVKVEYMIPIFSAKIAMAIFALDLMTNTGRIFFRAASLCVV
jgi:hypothetical protein